MSNDNAKPAYKTASWFMKGVERWFVIRSELAIDQLIYSGDQQRISDEITCTCPNWATADLIATALNRSAP